MPKEMPNESGEMKCPDSVQAVAQIHAATAKDGKMAAAQITGADK